jgi:deoxyadenosine/deoxycytidine kinase
MCGEGDERRDDGPPAWARREPVERDPNAGPRVTIVGPCAAGKTTLVARLREQGLDAYAVAQEHSGVAYLWQLAEPDLLIFLDVDLATTAIRRKREWPAELYATQHERLAHARRHADLYLDGSAIPAEEVARQVTEFVATQQQATDTES